MKRLFKHSPTLKLSLWLAMVIALSVLVKSNPVFLQHEKLSVPATTSTATPDNRNIQQVQPVR